ncbi:sigma-70 region 2 family protein, partial [Vibrio harveyi]
ISQKVWSLIFTDVVESKPLT